MEDYKKMYEDAIERAKKYNNNLVQLHHPQDIVQDIFPELKESEEERIRKIQLGYWKSVGGKEWQGVPVQDVINWLEAVGEKKNTDCPEYCVKSDCTDCPNKKIYDNMDDLIADALIEGIKESDLSDRDKHNRITWINKHRNKPLFSTKREWSKDDEQMIYCLQRCLDELSDKNGWNYVYTDHGDIRMDKLKDWLKSLTPPYYCDDCKLKDSIKSWRPTNAQMSTLREVIANIRSGIRPYCSEVVVLEELYDDLKKIK